MATTGWCVLTLSLLVLLSLSVSADDCSKYNPCKNGGTCSVDTFHTIFCLCTREYTGHNCQYAKGRLRVFVKTGANLRNRDGPGPGTSDPYVRVVAKDHLGHKRTKETKTIYNNASPTFNQWLDFGVKAWASMTVQILDRDWSRSDPLSRVVKGVLKQFGRTNYRIYGYRGYVDIYITYYRYAIGLHGPPGHRGITGPSG